jgi:hypothetical protein
MPPCLKKKLINLKLYKTCKLGFLNQRGLKKVCITN